MTARRPLPAWADAVRTAWQTPGGPHALASPRTHEQYGAVLAMACAAMPTATAAQFVAHAAGWLASRTDLKPASRKSYAAALRAAARVLGATLDTIPHVTVPPSLPRPVETAVLLQVLRYIRDRHQVNPADPIPALLVLCRHGLRNSEACTLTRAQLVLTDTLTAVRVRSKRGPLREVPLNTHDAKVFRRYLATVPATQDTLFPDWDRGRLAAAWRDLRTALSLPPEITGVHALRHTFITNLHEAGEDIVTMQRLAGHRDIRSTQLYTQVSNKRTQAAVDKLPSLEPSS